MLAVGVIALLIPIFLLSQGGGETDGEIQGGGSNDDVAGKPLLPPMISRLIPASADPEHYRRRDHQDCKLRNFERL
ncbi:hypothetical protein Mapa_008140 [Marchantia paleacea]|nr:hypothetical protein Mapa_008140 [Marchantia paleacea]